MTTPIDELAGIIDSFTGRRRIQISDDDIADLAAELAARSTPVPASNVSEGLRDVLSRHFVTRRLSEAHWRAIESDLAALVHAAPERLDAASLAEEGLDAIEDAITLLEAAPAYLWTAGEPDETIAALRALAARLSQPDATEEAERAGEYGRLLAERDRLIEAGADPDELIMPKPPSEPRDA